MMLLYVMWGRRPQAPAKGTCPFGIPETFHFAASAKAQTGLTEGLGTAVPPCAQWDTITCPLMLSPFEAPEFGVPPSGRVALIKNHNIFNDNILRL
jgi:hypothetical protein